MKIFISWSGDFSREIAKKLKVWIPSVIQSVDVFFSPDDIGKGENWNNVLSKELNDCNFGIVCLTPENVTAPWIHFEAGALAKALDSRVSSIMFGVNTSDIKGPLSRFQNTKFERNDFFKLLQAINVASDRPLKPENLTYSFDTLWERLDKEIEPIILEYESNFMTPEVLPKTKDGDAIQEILSIVRKMSSSTLSDKCQGPENNEFPHTIFGKVTSESIAQFHFLLKKRFPYKPLCDTTKNILRVLLEEDVYDEAISSLEYCNEYRHITYIPQNIAQITNDVLAELSDLSIGFSHIKSIIL